MGPITLCSPMGVVNYFSVVLFENIYTTLLIEWCSTTPCPLAMKPPRLAEGRIDIISDHIGLLI